MKRWCSCLLAVLLLLAMLPTGVKADNRELAMLPTGAEADGGRLEVYDMVADGLTYYWADASGTRVSLQTDPEPFDAEKIADDGAGVLPASYYAQTVTPVRDQGNSAACWTYATLAVLESDYVGNGWGTRANTDFSEAHLTWFANRGLVQTADDPTAGDGTLLENPYDAGGSFLMAIAALARGAGITTEAKFPMNIVNYPSFPQNRMYVSDARMTNALLLSSRADIKQAVIDNGGVAVCFYADTAGVRTTNTAMRNGVTGEISQTVTAYNHKIAYTPNHAVTIVGWDDSFPRAYFNPRCTPSANGAWLCKNSWGDSYDDKGYMWISYEDTTLIDACTLTVAPKSMFDDIYQYDGYGYRSMITVNDSDAAYMANVFRAKQDAYLRYVSFYTIDENLDYNISVYTDMDNGYAHPADGTLALTVSGSEAFAGYHTVDLGAYIPLTGGTCFSVVVELPCARTASMHLPVEGKSKNGEASFAGNERNSYIGYNDKGLAWVDTVASGYNNTCIKAFTVNTNPGTAPAAITNPHTLTDAATGVRVTCNANDFPAHSDLRLRVTENTAHAAAIKTQLGNQYAGVSATSYDIALLVNGKAVKTAPSGFQLVLPVADPGAMHIRAARSVQSGDSYSVQYLADTLTDGVLRVRVDNLNGCLSSVGYTDTTIIDPPVIRDQLGFLSTLRDIFQRIIDFFKKLFNIV